MRNKIKNVSKNGETEVWIRIPTRVDKTFTLIKDVLIDNSQDWRNMHIKTFFVNYGKSFEGIDFLKEIYNEDWTKLADFNIEGITKCCEFLDIETKLVRSSDLNATGKKSELILNICKELGATEFFSTVLSRDYLENTILKNINKFSCMVSLRRNINLDIIVIIVKVNIIAEIGSNWEGDIELAKLYIKKSKESGASHVKFQMWHARDLYKPSDPYWNEIQKAELTEKATKELKRYADKIGIEWFCSVFYPEAVDILESINVKIYKIASWTTALKHRFAVETIKKIGETRKPTFISTGYGADKKKLKENFLKKTCEFTYCLAEYPARDNRIDWKDLLNHNFFSDHTLGITIPITYVILKKQQQIGEIFIEKHVKLNNAKGQDSPYSISFDELTKMVEHIKRIGKLKIPKL